MRLGKQVFKLVLNEKDEKMVLFDAPSQEEDCF
jgi:hypothetical protein